MTAYWQLLRDPRWQRMRLEVMQRADFACEECHDRETMLNVHHTYYAKGRKPWEYEPESLRCLCERCHSATTDRLSEVARLAGSLPPEALDDLLGYLRYQATVYAPTDINVPTIAVESPEQASGVCAASGIRGDRRDEILAEARAGGGRVTLDYIIEIVVAAARAKAAE